MDIQRQLIQWNKLIEEEVQAMTTFDKKRVIGVIDSLFKFIDIKQSQLGNREQFRFVDEPIPQESVNEMNNKPNMGDIKHIGQKLSEAVQVNSKSSDVQQATSKLSGLKNVKVTIGWGDGVGGHVLISDISNTIVTTNQTSIPTSVHLKGVESSILRINSSGPVFIHDVSHTVLVLSCHQLRLHNIVDSTIIVESVGNNRIIIENCNGLKLQSTNEIAVDDFNWPTTLTTNPHYKFSHEIDDFAWIESVTDGPTKVMKDNTKHTDIKKK